MEYRLVKLWNLIPNELKVCSLCHKKLELPEAEIHHKDGKRYNDEPENLDMLCSTCHRGTNLEESMIVYYFRVPKSLLKNIHEEAEQLGYKHTVFTRIIIENYFKNKKSNVVLT